MNIRFSTPLVASSRISAACCAVLLATCTLAQTNAWAVEQDVLVGSTDLTNGASYNPSSAPTATTDATFLNSVYAPTAFTVNANLGLGTLNDLDTTQALTISNTGASAATLTLSSAANSVSVLNGGAANDLLFVNTGANLTVANGSATLGLNLGAAGNLNVAGTAAISSVVSGTNGLTKTGVGNLTLSGANTYTGGTNVNAGTLTFGGATGASLGTSPITIAAGATATTNFGNVALTSNNKISGTGTLNTTNLGTGGTTLTLQGDLSGFSGTLNIGGGGSSGKVAIKSTGANAINSTATINVLNNATLFQSIGVSISNPITLTGVGNTENLGALRVEGATISGSVLLKTNSTIGTNAGTGTISGVISGAGFGITKQGITTTVLTASNTYTGATVVGAGTLLVNGSIVSPVTVNNGTTFGGTGTVNGTISVSSGGTLNTGNGGTAIGTLTTTSSLSLAAGGTFKFDLNTTADTADKINANGVNLGGANLLLADLGSGSGLSIGQQFTLIDNTSAAAITGTFAGLAEGGTVSANGITYTGSYIGGTGNDFVLTVAAVPEPSVFVTLLGGIGMLGLARRRL